MSRTALALRGIFGIPLPEAVKVTRQAGLEVKVPTVVYRCIEYLEYTEAAKVEGIFLLCGRHNAIMTLKDRFDSGVPESQSFM